jgi:hypothetical protein
MSRNRIEQHPDEFRQDLNPDYEAGENHRPTQQDTRSAYDIKELHQQLHELRDDELKAIPVLAKGSRLAQGAHYFDLRHPERGEFQALGSMTAGPENWYVPKTGVDYQLWNLLIGVDDPDRMPDLVQQP